MLKRIKTQLGTSIRRLLWTPRSSPTTTPVATATHAVRSTRRPQDPASLKRRHERLQQRLMRRDLHRLLELHADSRRLMRHLGLVERTLRKDGIEAVERLPRPVLAKALLQLELLVRDWSAAGLADVRSRLAIMLRNRPDDTASDAAANSAADADTDADVDADDMAALERGLIVIADPGHVSDLDQAAFEEMERSWAGRAPTKPMSRAQRSDA